MIEEKNMLFLVDGAKGHTGTFLIEALLKKYPHCKIIATDLPSEDRDLLMTKEKVFNNEHENMLDLLNNFLISTRFYLQTTLLLQMLNNNQT